jgi:hypothetical protein
MPLLVCIYLSELFHANLRTDLENDNFECLWLWLRPLVYLSRPLCGIAICAVCHPSGLPQDDHQSLKEYLSSTIDLLCNRYPNCGIILLGDFNNLEISHLSARHNLKQVVKAPTRGSSILDLIITNLLKYYQTPQLLPPLGSSDHNIILWAHSLHNSIHCTIIFRKIISLCLRCFTANYITILRAVYLFLEEHECHQHGYKVKCCPIKLRPSPQSVNDKINKLTDPTQKNLLITFSSITWKLNS